MRTIVNCLIGLILLFSGMLYAATDRYPFSSLAAQQRFDYLLSELRCLVCQNQTLAESNAPLAEDLRKQVYEMIEQGQNDKAITDFLVGRYGEFVLFEPPVNHMTYLLWFGPFILLALAAVVLYGVIYKRNR